MPTVLLSAVVIARAARIGVIVDDDGLIIRNQWRTYRIQWREVRDTFSKTSPMYELQFVYLSVRGRRRPIRIFCSYTGSHRDDLLALLRRRGKGSTAGLTAQDFRRNDNMFRVWREARRQAADDPASVGDARRDFLRYLSYRIPAASGAVALALVQAGLLLVALALLVILAVLAGLVLTIRASASADE
ncbi:MAG: hypothetical protein M3394_04700 [Actinomycetota bacterium]|nr:hypothetical protein [Actinomycetota bacterium]